MFLLFAGPGAVLPILTLRLEELHFTPVEMAWTCAMQSVAVLCTPFVAGQAADRWFPTEKCLGACAIVAGIIYWILGDLTTPGSFFLGYLGLWLVVGPSMTLSNSLSFTHLDAPEQDFGRV